MLWPGIFFIVFFYSGTFPAIGRESKVCIRPLLTWYQTGSKGNGHEKPWPYWLELVLRYEWPVLIGLFLCLVCQFFQSFVTRYLAIYGVGVFAAYSIIHYKTPWIIISIVWPLPLCLCGRRRGASKFLRKPFAWLDSRSSGFIVGALLSYPVQAERGQRKTAPGGVIWASQ